MKNPNFELTALSRAEETDIDDDLPKNAPDLGPPEHTGEHRAGRPRKLGTDPELRAFVVARIDHMTYPQLADAVAETFPPARRVGRSAIHAWWKVQNRR